MLKRNTYDLVKLPLVMKGRKIKRGKKNRSGKQKRLTHAVPFQAEYFLGPCLYRNLMSIIGKNHAIS